MFKCMQVVRICVLLSCLPSIASPGICTVPAQFMTERDRRLNVDSVAVWHGPDGQHWLVATAKASHTLPVYDAVTGQLIKTIGEPGTDLSQLQRPNGIAILDDLLFIIERDNKRLQIFNLPEGTALGMTTDMMSRPYGLTVVAIEPYEHYMIYVTENAGPHGGNNPKKIHQYEAIYQEDHVELQFVKTFGDDEGNGALWKVESIAVDLRYNRLFIADEHKDRRNVKIYTLDGQFTGQTIGDGLILHEPEGIALYETSDQEGYIIVTDQHRQGNQFWLFDRETLEPIKAFIGEHTRNTDGIATTNQSFGPFSSGAFYAVHDDGNIHAYDWHTLATICGIEEKGT